MLQGLDIDDIFSFLDIFMLHVYFMKMNLWKKPKQILIRIHFTYNIRIQYSINHMNIEPRSCELGVVRFLLVSSVLPSFRLLVRPLRRAMTDRKCQKTVRRLSRDMPEEVSERLSERRKICQKECQKI